MATFHLTVSVEFETQELNGATENGPAAALTPIVMVELRPTPPPPALPSRAVSRKLRFRAYVGRISPIVCVLFRMSASLGKIRVGFVVPLKLRNMGAFPEGELGEPAGPRSNSSHV